MSPELGRVLHPTHVHYDDRDLSPFGEGQCSLKADSQLGGVCWDRALKWGLCQTPPEPNHQVDPVPPRCWDTRILPNQLIANCAPQLSVLAPLDLHRYFEVLSTRHGDRLACCLRRILHRSGRPPEERGASIAVAASFGRSSRASDPLVYRMSRGSRTDSIRLYSLCAACLPIRSAGQPTALPDRRRWRECPRSGSGIPAQRRDAGR